VSDLDWPTDEDIMDDYFVAARWPVPFPWEDLDVVVEALAGGEVPF
jgi:hypothetical protein